MIVVYSPPKDERAKERFAPGQEFTAIAHLVEGSTNLVLILDGESPRWCAMEEFEIPPRVTSWPISRRWAPGSGFALNGSIRWTGFGYRTLMEEGSDYYRTMIFGDDRKLLARTEREARLEGVIERTRDTVLNRIDSWGSGQFTYLEMATWAEEALDGSIARILYDNPEVVMILAELMSLDQEPSEVDRLAIATGMIARL